MNILRKPVVFISFTAVVVILLPKLTDWVMHLPGRALVGDVGDWVGFNGNLLGTIIGSIISVYIALYVIEQEKENERIKSDKNQKIMILSKSVELNHDAYTLKDDLYTFISSYLHALKMHVDYVKKYEECGDDEYAYKAEIFRKDVIARKVIYIEYIRLVREFYKLSQKFVSINESRLYKLGLLNDLREAINSFGQVYDFLFRNEDWILLMTDYLDQISCRFYSKSDEFVIHTNLTIYTSSIIDDYNYLIDKWNTIVKQISSDYTLHRLYHVRVTNEINALSEIDDLIAITEEVYSNYREAERYSN